MDVMLPVDEGGQRSMVVDTDGRRHMGPSSGGGLGPCKHT